MSAKEMRRLMEAIMMPDAPHPGGRLNRQIAIPALRSAGWEIPKAAQAIGVHPNILQKFINAGGLGFRLYEVNWYEINDDLGEEDGQVVCNPYYYVVLAESPEQAKVDPESHGMLMNDPHDDRYEEDVGDVSADNEKVSVTAISAEKYHEFIEVLDKMLGKIAS